MLLQRQRATWSEHSSELYTPLSVKREIPIEKGNTDTNAPPDPNDEIFLAARISNYLSEHRQICRLHANVIVNLTLLVYPTASDDINQGCSIMSR